MKPISSASGMKVAGSIMPFSAWCQRISASMPVISLLAQIDDRLVVELELARRQRLAQVVFHERAGSACARPSRASKKREGAAALALGPIEREVGVAHQLGRSAAVVGTNGDANAGADHHLLAVDVVGRD